MAGTGDKNQVVCHTCGGQQERFTEENIRFLSIIMACHQEASSQGLIQVDTECGAIMKVANGQLPSTNFGWTIYKGNIPTENGATHVSFVMMSGKMFYYSN